VLTVLSGVDYFVRARQQLRGRLSEKTDADTAPSGDE